MLEKPLSGKRIGVLVESKYIPEEILAYQQCFKLLGAEVELISRLWYDDSVPIDSRPKNATFLGDVDPLDNGPWETAPSLIVKREITTVRPDSYAAVIMSANYTSVRLRYSSETLCDLRALVQSPPAVKWFADAMRMKNVVKGALCHGLWILTPNPKLLMNRRVVCNQVVLADILNCGANATLEEKVVVDEDLVTGLSKHEVVEFIEAIANQILARQTE